MKGSIKKSALPYAPQVKEAAVQIVQQLPPELNSLALQNEIAEAIVARSRSGIMEAIQEAISLHPSSQQKPITYNINVGDININVDNSQVANYWIDNSSVDNSAHNYWIDNSRHSWTANTTYTDSSAHNYWIDNRNCESRSAILSQSSQASSASDSLPRNFQFDFSKHWAWIFVLFVLALGLSNPCAQESQRHQFVQQQHL